jgi:hypothetical protein
MSDAVTRCKRRADLENDEHISGAEWKALISETYGELYSEVALTGYRYFEYDEDITATGAASYDEPDDHMSTVSLCRVESTGRIVPLIALEPGEERRFAGMTGDAIGYQLIDDLIYLYPKPNSGTYRLRYIPQPPNLGAYADDGVIDVVTPDGEAFLVWGVTVLAKSKSESDVTLAMQRQEAARERVQVWAANRSMDGRRRNQGVELEDVAIDEGEWPR